MSLFARSLDREQLRKLLENGKQAKTIRVADACFSGRSGSGQQLVPGLQPLIVVADKGPSKELIMATVGKSNAFGGALPGMTRTAFSDLLLGVLLGWGDGNRDGVVTAKEAWAYTQQVLSGFLTGRRQTPELNTSTPDYKLAQGTSQAGPDRAEMRLAGSAPPSPVAAAPPAPIRTAPVRPQPTIVQQVVSLPLTVTTTPPGVPSEVDGQPVGVSLLVLRNLRPGTHTVAAFFYDEIETGSMYTSASRPAKVDLRAPTQTRFQVHTVFSQMFGDFNGGEGIYWLQVGWLVCTSRGFVAWLEGGLGLGWVRPGGSYRDWIPVATRPSLANRPCSSRPPTGSGCRSGRNHGGGWACPAT